MVAVAKVDEAVSVAETVGVFGEVDQGGYAVRFIVAFAL